MTAIRIICLPFLIEPQSVAVPGGGGKVAKKTGIKTPNLSRMERQSDMQVATLRKIVSAVGGKLEIIARFKDTAVKIILPA